MEKKQKLILENGATINYQVSSEIFLNEKSSLLLLQQKGRPSVPDNIRRRREGGLGGGGRRHGRRERTPLFRGGALCLGLLPHRIFFAAANSNGRRIRAFRYVVLNCDLRRQMPPKYPSLLSSFL